MLEATQNVAKHVSVVMRDSGTGAGATMTAGQISSLVFLLKKGGSLTQTVITPAASAVGTNGLLDIALTASHLDTIGVAALNITGNGLIPNDDLFIDVVAINKNDSVRGGLTGIPNAAAGASGGLPTIGATIPDATAGTASGLALKQNVDDATTTVNSHTDTATAAVTSGVNSHTDTATAAVTSGVNSHTDTATAAVTSGVNSHTDTATAAVTSGVNSHTDAAIAAGVPSAAAVRDSILDALLSDHSTSGTVADGIAIAAGLLQGNFMMDKTTNDPNGQTDARLRIWRDASGVPVTGGGSGQGQFAEFQVSTSYASPGQVVAHRVVRVTPT